MSESETHRSPVDVSADYDTFIRERRTEISALPPEAAMRRHHETLLEAACRFKVLPSRAAQDVWTSPSRPLRLPRALAALRAHAWTSLLSDPLRTWVAGRSRHPTDSMAITAAKARATVVVLSYRRPAALRRTLRSLRETTDASTTEIIVVDNGSTSATRRLLEDALEAKLISGAVISHKNLGVSAGYNLGFSLASPRSEFLTKLDHDQVLLTNGWLTAATSLLVEHPDIGIVALDQVNHPMLQSLPIEESLGIPLKSWWLWTCGSTMTVSRRTRDAVLGEFLETDLQYFPDDVDYGLRARLAGFAPRYLVQHCSYHIIKARGSLTRRSRAEAQQVAAWSSTLRSLKDEYILGERPLFFRYSRYGNLEFSAQRHLLVLDATF